MLDNSNRKASSMLRVGMRVAGKTEVRAVTASKGICFENRDYLEFAGLDAQGDLTVEIKDYTNDNTGSLVNVQFDLEYFIP